MKVSSPIRDLLESENVGKLERERDDPENRACEISLARLSPATAASAAGMHATFICGGFSG